MPIKQTFRNAALIDAAQHVPDAARAERITQKRVSDLWTALPDDVRNGLVAFAGDEASDGASLADWRRGFGAVFAEMNDREVSALIRVAVALAGGVVTEEEATTTTTTPVPEL